METVGPVLTMLDVMGIQDFIFSTNKLKDAIGGSRIVELATSTEDSGWLECWETNVIVPAGGNARLEFDSMESAKAFATTYSRKILDDAPGLEVAIAHQKLTSYPETLIKLELEIQKAKLAHRPSVPLMGLGVTATCRATGLPATNLSDDDPPQPIARRVKLRRDQAQRETRWNKFLENKKRLEAYNYVFPLEFDDLGRSFGDTSMIGVVHIDANGLGLRFKTWLETQQQNNVVGEEFNKAYQALSEKVTDVLKNALHKVIEELTEHIGPDPDNKQNILVSGAFGRFQLISEGGNITLPIRPIILSGDDLTFVCDGRIAVELAATALEVFQKSSIEEFDNSTVYACAGIAIVKSHFPFSRAYELAEALCKQAKDYVKSESSGVGCALNWQIGMTGLQHEQHSSLTMRPYVLRTDNPYDFTWESLVSHLLSTKPTALNGKLWQESRNKLKSLPGALHHVAHLDEPSIKPQLDIWNVGRTSKLELPRELESGFDGKTSPLLDALELLDFYLGLDVEEEYAA
jgi:hypothetical protein